MHVLHCCCFLGKGRMWRQIQAHRLGENSTKEGLGLRFEPRTYYRVILVSNPAHLVPLVFGFGPINKISPTCHQQLYSALIRHLLRWMIRDEIEHICSAVRLPQIRNPQGAVICSRLSKVFHPAHERWIGQDSSTVENVSETQEQIQMLH